MAAPCFPLMGVSRHRLGIDGQGVTTLVGAQGCPLRCRMCLNPHCWNDESGVRRVTVGELYDMVRVDDLYFRATGGGVTFGGGEPLTHAGFIAAFRERCGDGWRIMAETSLNVPADNLRVAMGCVDEFLADIKDMNPDIYRRYTGADNGRVVENLKALVDRLGPARVTVRVPDIPGFNGPDDIAASVAALRAMGVEKLDRFTYRVLRPRPDGGAEA